MVRYDWHILGSCMWLGMFEDICEYGISYQKEYIHVDTYLKQARNPNRRCNCVIAITLPSDFEKEQQIG